MRSPTADVTSVDRIRTEQVRSIYRNTTPGLTATLIAVCVLTGVFVYIDAADMEKAAVFIGAMTLQTLPRMWLHRRYARAVDQDTAWRRWGALFVIGAVAGGLTLGCGSIWMMSGARIDLQVFSLLLIFGVSAGALSAFGAYPPAFYGFFLAVSATPTMWLLLQGDVLHVTMGALFVLWVAAVAEQARRASNAFIESTRLRFENVDLVEDLRREKAIADEANAAKSRFLAAASHDLRQPVHALSLFVAALRLRKMDHEAHELLDHVDGSVHAMGRLFGGLLDISRLDAGVVEINRTAFAIAPMIERICHDYAAQAEAKALRVRVRASAAVVVSDALLIERVLRNLIDNAITYTASGSILVGCRRRGQRLCVQVWDTGPGIAESQQPLVFQEFYQLGNPERDRTKGVGLGLAIVKRLTTLLDHPLRLHSTVGAGSCFSFELPLAASNVVSIAAVGEPAMPTSVTGSGLILVIDDEASIQTGMKSLLSSWGYDVIAAATCAEILDRIAARNDIPKLVISDYRLRGHENGIDVIERLRSEFNDDIPGMLITGDTAPDRLREAQQSGFLLLHKPVPNSRLRAAITHLIEERPAVSA